MEETNGDNELARLTADAQAIDEELAALRPKANASRLGSADRRRYARLRDRSAAAWRRVFARNRRWRCNDNRSRGSNRDGSLLDGLKTTK